MPTLCAALWGTQNWTAKRSIVKATLKGQQRASIALMPIAQPRRDALQAVYRRTDVEWHQPVRQQRRNQQEGQMIRELRLQGLAG